MELSKEEEMDRNIINILIGSDVGKGKHYLRRGKKEGEREVKKK